MATRGDEVGVSPTFDAAELDGPSVMIAKLIVTDSFGASSLADAKVTILNANPTAAIETISSIRREGTRIDVTASASDPAGNADTLTFDYQVFKDDSDTPFAVGGDVDQRTFAFTPTDDGFYEIVLTVSDEEGGSTSVSETIEITNAAPSMEDRSFELVENPSLGFELATLTATDPGNDPIRFQIVGGSGASAFAIDAITGMITVSDPTLIDYDTTPAFDLQVEASDQRRRFLPVR